jgi:hypothetical protein
MASDFELDLARLTDSVRRPRPPRELAVRLRQFADLLREAPAAPAGPRLLWRAADQSVRAVAVGRRLVIGRDEKSDLVIGGARVSRHHAAVQITDGLAEVEDLRSANGTFVNGVRVEKRMVLRDGDLIEIGGSCVAYVGPL